MRTRLLGTVLAIGFVKFHWVGEVVDFPNLCQSLRDCIETTFRDLSDEESDSERVPIKCVPANCQ